MRHYFYTLLVVMGFCSAQAQSGLWSEVHDFQQREARYITPDKYLLYTFDFNTFAGSVRESQKSRNVLELTVPLPDGDFDTYMLTETSVFEDELSRKYPGFTAYTGYSSSSPGSVLKLSVSPFGINGMILAADASKNVFIDPLTPTNNNQIYQVYYKSDYHRQDVPFSCGVDEFHVSNHPEYRDINNSNEVANRSFGDCQLRSYRLALACTGEYASFHGRTIERVLAAFNTTITRVTGVYERDLGITLKLIGNTDALIFLEGNTDPYSNNNGDVMLGENQRTVDRIIGSANYDIGHVFSTGGGGIAFLNSPCNTSNKAKGVTGSDKPFGDPFDIDYVCHEMGHQFGANHTQNNNCNRNSPTAIEPGSASTIMGYAGICPPDVQSNSDGYFHGVSINEVHNYIVNGLGNTCATIIEVPNTKPVIEVLGKQYTIPVSTSFALTATGQDDEDKGLTYCWEQTDSQTASMPPKANSSAGPLFRSVFPDVNPTRFFPDLKKKYGQWEVLPTVSRNMNFKCTVRDNHPQNGCTEDVNVTIKTTTESGPFLVTNPNTRLVSWQAGTIQPISWDVANSDKSPVNCQIVSIVLSVDGGATYPFELVSGIPNTGSYQIQVPSYPTDRARIMVKAADNVFFDVSDENFKITTSFTMGTDISELNICDEDEWTTSIYLKEVSTIKNPVVLSVPSPIAGLTYTFSDNTISSLPDTVKLTISGLKSLDPDEYQVVINAISGTELLNSTIHIFKGLAEDNIQLVSPLQNSAAILPSNVLFSWNKLGGVKDYLLEISESPAFDSLIFENRTQDTQIKVNLKESTIYYWRVKPVSHCVDLPYSEVFSFRTSGAITGSAILLRNETLLVDQAQSAFLTDKEIDVRGDNPDFIIYTITGLPVEGQLFIEGKSMDTGDRFSMTDVLNGKVEYRHAGGFVTSDTITVSVLDDASRWIPEVVIPVKIKTAELGLIAIRNKTLKCYGDNNAEIALTGFGGVPPYQYSVDGNTFADDTVFKNLDEGIYTFYIKDDAGDITQSDPVILKAPSKIVVDAQQKFYDITVDAAGGTGTLSYSLNGGVFLNTFLFENPGNGLHIIQVKDIFECIQEDTVSISVEPLNVEAEVTSDAVCAGQIITLSVKGSGGIPPYTYSTNNQNYTESDVVKTLIPNPVVYIKDAGGKIVHSDTVWTKNPQPLHIAFNVKRFTVTVQATGGTGPLVYSKNDVDYSDNNIFEFSDNGVYRIYVRDSVLCSMNATVQINAIKAINVTKKDVTCHDKNDGYLKLVSQGGASPFQYKLNNGNFSSTREWKDLSAGIYNYTVRDSKADSLTGEIEILNPEALSIELLISKDTLDILVNGGTPPYRYSIDNGGLFLDTNLYTELDPGTYSVVVKDKNGCDITGTAVLTQAQDLAADRIVLYPNPVSRELYIRGMESLSDYHVDIIGVDGVKTAATIKSKINDGLLIDVSMLTSGMYIVRISNSNNVATFRFLKI